MLKDVLARFTEAGIRTSLFIETDQVQIEAAADVGADRIELYTESFATQHAKLGARGCRNPSPKRQPMGARRRFGRQRRSRPQPRQLARFCRSVPHLDEVSIGHAFISDALYLGMSNAVAQYRACFHPPRMIPSRPPPSLHGTGRRTSPAHPARPPRQFGQLANPGKALRPHPPRVDVGRSKPRPLPHDSCTRTRPWRRMSWNSWTPRASPRRLCSATAWAEKPSCSSPNAPGTHRPPCGCRHCRARIRPRTTAPFSTR